MEYFFNCEIKKDWLSRTRKALFLSINHLSKKIGIAKQSLREFENNEHSGNITISTLTKIAEAMDCELVYAIRPKTKKLFGEIIWDELGKAAVENYRGFTPSEGIEKRKAWYGQNKMFDPKFRKSKSWSKRKRVD